jgi:tetratricopeptide (TPR) repeat protein
LYVEALMLYAEALVGNGELYRALEQYNVSLAVIMKAQQLLPKTTPAPSISNLITSLTSSSASSASSSNSTTMISITTSSLVTYFVTQKAKCRLRRAEVWAQLRNFDNALENLDYIELNPAKATLTGTGVDVDMMVSILMLKAECYQQKGLRENAIECFKHALNHNVYCTEACASLVRLAPDQCKAIFTALKRQLQYPDDEWYSRWLDMQIASAAMNAQEVTQSGTELLTSVGGYNSSLVLAIANAHVTLENFTEAITSFEQVRTKDKYVVERMDEYAELLHKQYNNLNELSRLAEGLITYSPKCACLTSHKSKATVTPCINF